MTAYNTAIKELIEKGYLIPAGVYQDDPRAKRFIFYEKSQKPNNQECVPDREPEKRQFKF